MSSIRSHPQLQMSSCHTTVRWYKNHLLNFLHFQRRWLLKILHNLDVHPVVKIVQITKTILYICRHTSSVFYNTQKNIWLTSSHSSWLLASLLSLFSWRSPYSDWSLSWSKRSLSDSLHPDSENNKTKNNSKRAQKDYSRVYCGKTFWFKPNTEKNLATGITVVFNLMMIAVL